MPDLLFELGTEEIPATYFPPVLDQLKRETEERLKALGLGFESVLATATPRRLVLAVADLPLGQASRTDEVPGPPEKASFKDGQPTSAAKGFAEKNGVRVEDLVVKDTPKGRYVFAQKRVEGRRTADLLTDLLPQLVKALAFPKSMRWPQAPGASFPRPVRRVLALFGGEVLPVAVLGIRAGRTTLGHPVASGARELAVERADYASYRALLRSHGVIVDRHERRGLIEHALADVRKAHTAVFREHALLEEVTDLVELPEVMVGGFDEKYLTLPPEVIVAAMTDHQRYFPLVGEDGAVRPRFAFVANRPKERAALIREGNERVLRARLEDATFYLKEDLKRPLRERAQMLQGVSFHEKLGTMLDKSVRLEALAGAIARAAWPEDGATAEAARTAGRLSKADLTTELVKEFPELQGAIGCKYALLQNEPPEVAEALREQYLPRFAGDELPMTKVGLALSLAEKLDNLTGFFAAGLVPTGSADPYALRRQAGGVVRILVERQLDASLSLLATEAAAAFVSTGGSPFLFPVLAFVQDRAKQAFLDQGYRYDLVDAAMAAGADDLADLKRRLDALTALAKEPSFPDLVELVERTYNISKALPGNPKPVREELLTEREELALYAAWRETEPAARAAFDARDYAGAAKLYLERLKAPVHAFFEKVFVNVEDAQVRENRLSLLKAVNRLFATRFADLSKVAEGKK